jgi:phage baseplate assembly protein W
MLGSNVRGLLFELTTPLTSVYIKDSIIDLLVNHEPRIRLQDVKVRDDSENNGYNITLEYIILNRELPVVTTLFLERIR